MFNQNDFNLSYGATDIMEITNDMWLFCPKSTRSYAVSTHLYVSITSISFLKFTWFILHIGFLILKLLKHSSNQEQSFLFQLS